MAERESWFPDFCSGGTIFGVFIGAEVVALLMMFAATPIPELSWGQVGLRSLLAQLIALWSAALLCALKPLLNRLPVWSGSALAYLLILSMTLAATICAHWLNDLLSLGAIAPDTPLRALLITNLAVVSLVAAVALRYFYIRAQWRRDVETRARAQVQALQARIRPHFLFNSLNTIASLTRKRPEQAERAIEDLSDLFRAALSGPDRESTLDDELALCRRYLELEKLRLGRRLRVDWHIDDLPLHERIPPLLIQPLVENAIHHGIGHLRKGGTLRLEGGAGHGRWWFEISNPMPANPTVNTAGSGIALSNIRQRLDHRYGGRAKLTAAEREDCFVVRIEAPVNTS